MLHYVTWQQFLIASLILTTIWYAGILLIFYRKELQVLISKKQVAKKEIEPLPHKWEDEVEELENGDDLMGKPKAPEGLESIGMDGFGFAKKEDAKEAQLGTVPDVLEELKSVFNILAEEDGNKSDFFSLMKLVKTKYPNAGTSPNLRTED